jgi:uncharacterized protein DUF4388
LTNRSPTPPKGQTKSLLDGILDGLGEIDEGFHEEPTEAAGRTASESVIEPPDRDRHPAAANLLTPVPPSGGPPWQQQSVSLGASAPPPAASFNGTASTSSSFAMLPPTPSVTMPALAKSDLNLPGDDTPLFVELMPDGRLRAPVQIARELLRDRLKKAEVLRTGPRWAVLRTLDPGPIPSRRDRADHEREVIVAGTLGEGGISLIDFIGFLATGAQTGALTGSHLEVARSVYFHNGDVVWASSSAPEDRLGEFLLHRGKITREQLQLALRDGEKRFGRACVERGFIAAHDLHTMLAAQLTDIFDKMLAMDQGVWSFARMSPALLAESQIHLSTQGLLVDALRRLDELQIYRQRIKSPEVIVQRVTKNDRGPGSSDTIDLVGKIDESVRVSAEHVLRHLPGAATISELMQLTGKGEFDVTRAVYHLLRRGLVEIVQEDESSPIPKRPESLSKTEAHEIISIYGMAIREMFNEVSRIAKADGLQAAANGFLKDEKTAYARFLSGTSVAIDGSLDEEGLVSALQGVHTTSQQLSDALSELLFFVLFQATEFLGRRRGDDLARRVKLILGLLASSQPASGGSDGG